jgi:hypothetical protein
LATFLGSPAEDGALGLGWSDTSLPPLINPFKITTSQGDQTRDPSVDLHVRASQRNG